MSDVNLGSSSQAPAIPKQEKQKMIYMGIPSALLFITEARGFVSMKKYSDAMIQSIKGSLTPIEIRKTILLTFGVKTVKKMQRLKSKEFDIFTEVFGKEIWGLQEGQ